MKEGCGQRFRLRRICDRAGMSRQNFYRARRDRKAQEINERFVVELVKA